jgi:UDP-3-O-[3-hydroxymyristoyl] glucosamine N-acyltransferase
VLLPATNIGIGVDVQSSCWLEPGVMVGDGARISARCTLRSGALIAPRIHIGSDCELGWHRRYDADIAEKTVFDPRYDAPIRTYGS